MKFIEVPSACLSVLTAPVHADILKASGIMELHKKRANDTPADVIDIDSDDDEEPASTKTEPMTPSRKRIKREPVAEGESANANSSPSRGTSPAPTPSSQGAGDVFSGANAKLLVEDDRSSSAKDAGGSLSLAQELPSASSSGNLNTRSDVESEDEEETRATIHKHSHAGTKEDKQPTDREDEEIDQLTEEGDVPSAAPSHDLPPPSSSPGQEYATLHADD